MNAFVTVLGKDNVGIIYEVSKILKDENITILDINQTLMHGHFSMIMLIELKKDGISSDKLQNKFHELGEKLDIQIIVQAQEVVQQVFEV